MIDFSPVTTHLQVVARYRRRRAAPVPASVPVPQPAAGSNEQYLRRWIVHQAVLYNDLLATIAGAPPPASRG